MTMMDTLPHPCPCPCPCPHPSPETLRALIAEGPSVAAARPLLPDFEPTSLLVERVHFPGAKPVQVQIRASGDWGQSRTLIGEWVGPDADSLSRTEAARLAKPRRGQASSPGRAVVSVDPAHGLVLRRPGFDAKLPGLRLLHDTHWASARLADLGCDPCASVSLVAHRLGKRAVLRISSADGIRFARLRPVTSLSGQVAYDRHRAIWAALAGDAALSVPLPLGFDASLGLALFDALPGKPPQFRGIDGFRATQAVMRGLTTLQALPIDAPPHRPEDELALLDVWAARTADVFPDLAALLEGPLVRLRDDMAALQPMHPVPCHRDLHEGQVLLHHQQIGLLDFDTLRLGDPALDAGNLQAHLILATLRDGLSRQAFITAMDNALPQLPLKRIALWRRAALLRLAMIYGFSAEPRAVILGLIREAA